jgi:hypothetical protein
MEQIRSDQAQAMLWQLRAIAVMSLIAIAIIPVIVIHDRYKCGKK